MATAAVPLPLRTPTRMITVPGAGRVVMRRSAKDPSSGLTAYLVKENNKGATCNISVALKRKGRYIGTVLKGHTSDVVDMEFLPTPENSPIFTLGSCDRDGVVFLWFLRLAQDTLGIDYAIKQLRKYSFYSLRKNQSAFYNRIRLTGTPENGTMVLVPNDGSNVRVITFSCVPTDSPHVPAIEAPPPVPQIEAPIPAEMPLARLPAPPPPPPLTENKEAEVQIPTPQPISQEDFREAAAQAQASEEKPEEPRDILSSTFPDPRRDGPILVDDDIAEAAAMGAGITEDDILEADLDDADDKRVSESLSLPEEHSGAAEKLTTDVRNT